MAVYVLCPRCGQTDEGEIWFSIGSDSDGDWSVPGGGRSFYTLEADGQSCACDLSADEWETAQQAAQAKFDSDPLGYLSGPEW